MLQTGTMPDDVSYNMVVGHLILMNEIDSAFKYMDLIIKSGFMISTIVFMDCVRSCVNAGNSGIHHREMQGIDQVFQMCN